MSRFTLFILAIMTLTVLKGCALPKVESKSESYALTLEEAQTTALGSVIAPEVELHTDLTGVLPLIQASDAFAARALLSQAAEKTLDIQYYIWRRDTTGKLLLSALYHAAENGVRIRLLLDDNGTAGLDDYLLLLNRHPNIEVRLFNPFNLRKTKWLNFLTDFSRLNRRMHNKAFIADNQVAIIGGRNIGNEYFGAKADFLFNDLDVLAVGKAVQQVSYEFDRYWSSVSAYPLDSVVADRLDATLDSFVSEMAQLERSQEAVQYINDIKKTHLINQLLNDELKFEWAHTRMVSDDPAKTLGQASKENMLGHQLNQIIGHPSSHIMLITPYFVPTKQGAQELMTLAEKGIEIFILTNSLEATDVAAVHSGYAKYRKDLLKSGIQLYEMKRFYSVSEAHKKPGVLGSSAGSLHAKTFAIDSERVFVGSFNFDPRSANLNTELGFVIESAKMAQQIEQAFKQTIPLTSYKVELDEDGHLIWREFDEKGQKEVHYVEPNAGWFKRVQVLLFSFLPIEPLL